MTEPRSPAKNRPADVGFTSRHFVVQFGNYLMVLDPFVPAAQGLPGHFLDDSQFVVVSGESADGVQGGEERNGGEHDLPAIVLTQQAGAAESAEGAQVLADRIGVRAGTSANRRRRRSHADRLHRGLAHGR